MDFLVAILILSVIFFNCSTYIKKAVLVKKSLGKNNKFIIDLKIKLFLLIDERIKNINNKRLTI